MDSTKTPRPEKDSTEEGLPLREKAKAMYRQAILDAAEQVFGTKGIRGARIQDIAKVAGVSVGTVYNHFAQKDDIVIALATDQDSALKEAVASRPDDPADFVQAMRARHERVLQLINMHRGFYAFALYEGIFDSELVRPDSVFSPKYEHSVQRFDNFLEELLEQGMREGLVEPLDPVLLKHFHAGAFRGVLMAAIKDPARDLIEDGRLALELFLRAIEPRKHG